MSQEITPQPFESRYPALAIPPEGFISTIPPGLLIDADPQMAWLLNEVSKNTAATEFSCKGTVECSNHLRNLNGRVYKHEKSLAEAREELEALNKQAAAMSPFLKPLTFFAALWEYSVFKWIFLAGISFFTLIVYPYYLKTGFWAWFDSIAKHLGAP